MKKCTFKFIMTPVEYKHFVQDWIQTLPSTWEDVEVSRKRIGEMFEIYIHVSNNSEHVHFMLTEIFGKSGILTKKYWVPDMLLKTKQD